MPDQIPIARISELLAGYAARRYSPRDVVEEVARRIDAAGDDHVWIARVPTSEMLRRAAELSDQPACSMPLYGVPFAVKDNMDVRDMPTTAGCPEFAYQRREPRRWSSACSKLVRSWSERPISINSRRG
jgi:allophanate hydrolase